MKLSVVIVNYNVKYFLEQCLHSVFKALQNINAEVWVVDNNSVDGSCAMVREKFAQVKLIENKYNPGFSTANNQAIKQASGQYILLLNPDTLVQEDTFARCINFMDENLQAGVVGVKMIDGKGNFLPESKRSLPTPQTAFYKIFGLAALFPQSKIFNKYSLGYLNKNKTHQVEVLCGAFMFIRKQALEKAGLLDEAFFMYGEDIDLSYRIIKAGYKNYYLPETVIIHYKGESTKKGSLNYVLTFYNAMVIFVKKHLHGKNKYLFLFLIQIAIYFRASLAVLKRLLQNILLPLTDTAFILCAYKIFIPLWAAYKFNGNGSYPASYFYYYIPVFIFIWILSFFVSGAYDKPLHKNSVLRGSVAGTVIILALYALVPENYRYSRVLILSGFIFTLAGAYLVRYVFHFLKISGVRFENTGKKNIVIVASHSGAAKITGFLQQSVSNIEITGIVSPSENRVFNSDIGNLNQLTEIIRIYKTDEIIFNATDLTSQQIITKMLELAPYNIHFKIAPPESYSIIGSNSIHSMGELYLLHINAITKPMNIRLKRMLDFSLAFVFLITYPVICLFVKNKYRFFINCQQVLWGKISWVGYKKNGTNSPVNLPKIKNSILTPCDMEKKEYYCTEIIEKKNIIYAKNYKITTDLFIIFKSLKKLGNKIE